MPPRLWSGPDRYVRAGTDIKQARQRVNLELADEQKLIRETFARFLDEHSSPHSVRATRPTGFDPELWKGLAELGAFSIRVPEEAGGSGLGTFEAAILMEEVGRKIACGPIAEAIMACRLLGILGGAEQAELLNEALRGETVITVAYHDLAKQPKQWVAGGAVADVIIGREGSRVVLIVPDKVERGEPNLDSAPMAEIDLAGLTRTELGHDSSAVAVFNETIEEWKLLVAIALAGLSRQAIEMAAGYASERKAFGQYIGTFQAISHPLAVLITDTDAAKYFVWKTIRDISDGVKTAGAQISLALWWSADTSARSVSQAIQTFGGYGLTLDYDIHLYNLRAKAWPLTFGNPAQFLVEGGRRLYNRAATALPQVGNVSIDFDRGVEARSLAREVTEFFERNLTPDLRARAHFTWEGHDPEFHRKLADAGLLFPDWPRELGGREASPYAATSAREAFEDQGWSTVAMAVARMVGAIIHRFGSDELKRDVLPSLAAGQVVCSLGWSEPGAGSDVFAVQTRARRDGGGWRIDGQKMFTSGANIADYVYMIVRTDPDLPKHKGITMFIVPLDTPGITVQPVHSFQDEPTNVTFYDGVWVPDSYRLGEVNGGLAVMSATLELEHSASYAKTLQRMLAAGEELCRELESDGRALIEQVDAQRTLAQVFTQSQLAIALNERMLWASAEGKSIPACGPMARLQSAEAFFTGACDLLNLTAPNSLSKRSGSAAFINQCYRHAHAARIYGGSQEIQRSQIAERHLGLPRTRG